MGSIKDRNGVDLTEAEDMKKRWQEYTEELYKKDFNGPDNHNGVITHLEPDILECEVKWALRSITTNKASPLQFGSVALSCPTLCNPMPSNHLILWCPLLLLPSIFPSISVFSNKSALRIRWPKYWSFSFNISPSNEHPGLISFGMDWLVLLAVQRTLKSLLQHHSSKASILLCSASSGGDGIPVALFQILKDDAVKVLHSIGQQIWKTQQWPQDWKRSIFIPTPKKGNAKECSNYCTITLISHTSKVMLKILQTRLQQYVNCEIPDVQAGFRKGRGSIDQTANICLIIKDARVPEKHLLY